ncbi:LuxR C-terminal-related transcriptional regulator [Streptomyces sp. M19]
MSLREIGAQLFVSVNTVKSHTRAIYRKLGASSRDEALRRAAELRLL